MFNERRGLNDLRMHLVYRDDGVHAVISIINCGTCQG